MDLLHLERVKFANRFCKKEAFASLSSSIGSFNTLKNTLQFSSGELNNSFTFSGRLSQINSDGYIDRASSDLDAYFFQGVFRDENTLLKALFFGGKEITYQSWYGVDLSTLESNRTYNPAGEIYDENGNRFSFYDNQVDNYSGTLSVPLEPELKSVLGFCFRVKLYTRKDFMKSIMIFGTTKT